MAAGHGAGGSLREDYIVGDQEMTIVDTMTPICDGNADSLLGHPREYLTLERGLQSVCKYCDRRFVHVTHPDVAMIREKGRRFAA